MRSLALLLLAPLLLAQRAPVETPRLLANGWHYGEAGNYCMAIRELAPNGPRFSMRLAKWNDMSDSLIFWAPGLAPMSDEDEAAIARNHDVRVTIDGKALRLLPNWTRMLEDFDDKPGPTWRIGIPQAAFIAALARGKTLEIRRSGQTIARFPIARSSAMAAEFRTCVAKDPSF
jgi:hypothetical protein